MLVGRGSSDPDASSDLYKVARLLADGRGLGLVEPAFVGVARPERARRRSSAAAASARAASPSCPFFLFTGVLVPRIYRQAARVGGGRTRSSRCVGGPHLGPDRRLARLVLERYREALTGDVRMNCDLCTYRVRLPGYEDKVGTPISLTPHGDGPGARRPPRAPGDARARAARSRSRSRRPGAAPRARSSPVPEGTPPALALEGLAYAYPDGSAGARRRRPARSRPASGSPCSGPTAPARRRSRSQLCGVLEDAAGARSRSPASSSARHTRREIRRRVGIVFQDPDDQLFMPTVEADVAFGPANQGLAGEALRARVAEALDAVAPAPTGRPRRRTR